MNTIREILSGINKALAYHKTDYSAKSKRHILKQPIIFDIETSSYYDSNGNKRACMCSWALVWGDLETIGREWKDFYLFYSKLLHITDIYDVDIYIYVHNLPYEMGFMLKELYTRYGIDSAIFTAPHKPVKVRTHNVEWRCSYSLSQESLAHIGDRLNFPKSKDWDYSLIRTPATPLTTKEIEYNLQDCRVVQKYIETEKGKHGLADVPYTSTGKVRKRFQDVVTKDKRLHDYIHQMNITLDEFQQIHRAYNGGFTHASEFHVGEILKNVTSYDFNSSYPAVICTERYPVELIRTVQTMDAYEMTSLINDPELEAVCDVYIKDLEPLGRCGEYYLSTHKCDIDTGDFIPLCEVENPKAVEYYNGRIKRCSGLLKTTLTSVDLECLQYSYKWSAIRFENVRVYRCEYLPAKYLEIVLQFYKDKNQLKGVEGREIDYMNSKKLLNSCYGMFVQNPMKPDITYTSEGFTSRVKDETDIDKYNSEYKRIGQYIWGVFIAAYARRNLWRGIDEFGDDYVYSDTDSIKAINADNHRNFLEAYNREIQLKFVICMESRKVNTCLYKYEGFRPLGVWDFDGYYDRFKTLGAKRYIVEQDGEYHITVAGLPKSAVEYMKKLTNDPISIFNNGLTFPPGTIRKQTHTYIDGFQGVIKDYEGRYTFVREAEGIHLEPAGFQFSAVGYLLDLLLERKDS